MYVSTVCYSRSMFYRGQAIRDSIVQKLSKLCTKLVLAKIQSYVIMYVSEHIMQFCGLVYERQLHNRSPIPQQRVGRHSDDRPTRRLCHDLARGGRKRGGAVSQGLQPEDSSAVCLECAQSNGRYASESSVQN